MAGRVGALFVTLGLDDAQYQARMKGTVSTAQKSTALIQTNFSTLNFRTFLYGAAGVFALQRAIVGLMSPAANLEENLAKVSTVLDKSAMSFMPRYREQLQSMAKEFGQPTDTLSTGLREILGSVIAPTKAMLVLREASKAATAGLTDTATATDALVTILKSYGMQAEESARVNDILFAAILRGRGTYEQWTGSIGVVTASAALAGLKIEELAAMMAVMTRQGLSADMATISLANMLNSFIKPTTESAQAARKFGFELNTTTLRAIGMVGVMQRLKGATEEELAAIFPNIRGFRGMATAMQDLAGFTEDYQAIVKATGMTEEALAKITATFKFQLKQFGQIILANFVIPFTEALIPSIKLTIKEMSNWAEQNREVLKLKLTEWALRIKNAFDALVTTARMVEKWFKAIEIIFVAMFAQTIINRAVSFGDTLLRLVVLLGTYTRALGVATVAETALTKAQVARTLSSYAGTAKGMQKWLGPEAVGTALRGVTAGTIGGSAGLVGLFALEMGGAVYLGIKGIAEQLDKVDRMKFTDVKALADSATNMMVLSKSGKTDIQVFEETFARLAKEGKSFMDSWNLFLESTKGMDYGKIFGAERKTLMQMGYGAYQRALIKPKTLAVGAEEEDEKYRKHRRNMDLQEKEMKYWADREKGWRDQRIAAEKDVADETLRLQQDTLYEKANLIKDDTERARKIMELDKQNYMGSLKAKYEGITGYLEMVAAANKYYAGVETTIQFEAAQKAAQAWEGFKDHFSHVLARMVDEGKFSAKAIGDAFAGALKRIAIERVAQDTIDVLFDYLAPKGGSIRNFITSNKTPSGEASSFDKVLGALGTIATVASLFLGKGGMVYKPSLALVGEKGPERVLNPAETRAYNNSQDKILPYIGTALTRLATLVGETRPEQALNPVETHTYNADYQNDNSTVNIYIHTDADGLRSMDAYKFAQMYKEAKRSQLLAG